MDNSLDALISSAMKHWVSQHKPGSRVRKRLLWLASLPPPQLQKKKPQQNLNYILPISKEWMNEFVNWNLVYAPLIGIKGLH
jgi:hypothetical protein